MRARKLRLTFATRNPHKTRELAALFGNEVELTDLTGRPDLPAVEETGATFAENATLKACAVSRAVAGLVVADDSGLEVDVLGGAPGVFSARYAGESASDRENVAKLLFELDRLAASAEPITARFHCVLVLAKEGGLLATAAGSVEGRIIRHARGVGGFGYDPIFVTDGFEETFSELSAETKNRISHRAAAVARLRDSLLRLEPNADY